MGHFEDGVFTGVARTLGIQSGPLFDVGRKVIFADDPMVYEVVQCERTLSIYDRDGEYRYDLVNRKYNIEREHVPQHMLKFAYSVDALAAEMSVSANQPPVAMKVIFNNPATIVIWTDGTKTIVKKSKGDRYDREKGLAFCYLKKIYGKDYYKIIKHLTEEADN